MSKVVMLTGFKRLMKVSTQQTQSLHTEIINFIGGIMDVSMLVLMSR